MSETKLTRDLFVPFLDTTQGSTQGTYNWAAIDKSTVFQLDANSNTEDVDYICYAATQTDLTAYKPSMDQEIAIYEGNPCYDFLFEMFYNLDISKATCPVLICFGGTGKKAWLYDEAQIVMNDLNTVDNKLEFTINFNGDQTLGTYVITAGVPVFTAAA